MRRRRKLWIILLATPLILVAADAFYWRMTERSLEDGFAAWLGERRAAGWTATTQPPVRGGWPLAATLTVPGIELKGGDPEIPGGVAWGADRVTLRVSLLRPGVLDVAAGGMQHIRFADNPEVPYTADRLRVVLPLQPDVAPQAMDVTVQNLRAGMPAGKDATAGLTVGLLQLHADIRQPEQSADPALAFSLHADAINPPPGVARLLGPRIGSFSMEGVLDGAVPRAAALADRAAAWRDGGGSLEIRRFALNWGPLDLTASATLSLDEQLQPMGAGSARAVGYAETLDALAAHSAISRSAATAAEAVLSLLAHSPDDGGPPDVEVPLTLQYRTLSMRQVPLVRLPELDWP
jgi:hypothetical protein